MSRFDRAAEIWLRRRIPGADPDPGSVRFITNCAAYASGGWAQIDVEWTENGTGRGEELIPEAWQADLTTIIREIVEIDPDEMPAQSPHKARTERPLTGHDGS